MYMVDFIKEMIKTKKSSTLREMYYISEGWDLAKFHSQPESDSLAEDLEIITHCMREDFKLRPEEDGARVIGNVTIEEITRNNTKKKIHCQDDVGDSGYSIPYNVEPEKITFKGADADFILAIETGGMFDRLVENGFDKSNRAVLVHLKGQPARSTRRFIKRLNEEKNLPVLVFTDCDPWSYRIFGSVAYGAIKTAHISEYLATPSAQYLGVTPSDIENYKLPTDTLTKEDIHALKSELSDPRFQDQFWKHEIKLQLSIGKKSEQQALAKYGLDYVTDTYLPEKLAEIGITKK
jgi:DNA topoisomerase-6 subunit A